MPASDKSFSVSGIDIDRFANGKAVEHRGLTEDMTMAMQLGTMDKPEQATK